MKTVRAKILATSALLSTGLLSAPALAQQAPPAEATAIEGDIVVTATRREERLQNVPIAITALTGEKLVEKQLTEVINLAKVTPGMQAKTTFTPLEITTSIRGVTQIIPSINSDPPIGTYVDGVYNVLNAGSNAAFIDMERVEVIKGPQGTLFGRNTIGGAISITTAKPKDSFGGYAQADFGNYDLFTATGVLNLPIVPGTVDARFVYQHSEHGGYGKNFTTGNPTATFNQEYARGSIRIVPADGWEILATGFYADAKGFGPATKPGYVDTSASIVPALGPTNTSIPLLSGKPGDALSNYVGKGGFQDSYAELDNRYALKQRGATLSIVSEASDATTVKAIGGYIHTDYNTAVSLSGTPYVLVDLLDFPIDVDQYSGELQAYGHALDNRLNWIGGLYYFRESGSQIGTSLALPALSRAFRQPVNQSVSVPEVTNTSYSAYTQLTFEVVPGVRLTGGVRYVTDKREVAYSDHTERAGSIPGTYVSCSLANAPFSTDPAACHLTRSVTYHYAPWTVGIDYQPNRNLLLYAKVSKGYRSGAFTLAGPAAVSPSATVTPAQAAAATAGNLAAFAPAEPEDLLSPEVGFKLEALGGKLRLNGAAYYSRYNNVQVSVNGTAACTTCSPPSLLINSGKVEIWGGELESTLRLGDFTIDAVAGYTNPRYVSGPFVGIPVLNVSKFNGSVTGAYKIQARAGVFNVSSTYSYRTAQQLSAPSSARPAAWNASLRQPGFGMIDARASFSPANTTITMSIYGQNLTSEDYITSTAVFSPPFGYTIRWPGTPLTFGGSVKIGF